MSESTEAIGATEGLIRTALQAAGDLVPVSALEQAFRDRDHGPNRWLTVGRRSVGKTHLLNRLLNRSAPVGLGGVTDTVRIERSADLVLIDTPGLEDAFEGADLVESLLPDVDGVLWVVDGLQPLTSLERHALNDAVADEVITVAVVTRLDLVDANEHQAVMGRVRRLLVHRAVRAVLSGARDMDLQPVRDALAAPVPWAASPARRRELHQALGDVAASLSHLVHVGEPEPEALATDAIQAWTEAVDQAHQALIEQVEEGVIAFRDEALQALHNRLLPAAEVLRLRVHEALGESPSWRPSPPEALDLRGQLQDLVRGNRGVLDGLREGAARWSEEGQQALARVVELGAARRIRGRRRAIEEASHAVGAAMDGVG